MAYVLFYVDYCLAFWCLPSPMAVITVLFNFFFYGLLLVLSVLSVSFSMEEFSGASIPYRGLLFLFVLQIEHTWESPLF